MLSNYHIIKYLVFCVRLYSPYLNIKICYFEKFDKLLFRDCMYDIEKLSHLDRKI